MKTARIRLQVAGHSPSSARSIVTLYITPVYYYYMEKFSRRLNRSYGGRFHDGGAEARADSGA